MAAAPLRSTFHFISLHGAFSMCPSETAGSTACIAIFFGPDEEGALKLITAHAGDSRAVLCRCVCTPSWYAGAQFLAVALSIGTGRLRWKPPFDTVIAKTVAKHDEGCSGQRSCVQTPQMCAEHVSVPSSSGTLLFLLFPCCQQRWSRGPIDRRS